MADVQVELFHETLNDALRGTVAALGGLKVVGVRLFPEQPADAAGRHLGDCLNPDRPHGLHPDKLTLLLKLARDQGVHLAMHWLCDDVGYTRPSPVEPEDQVAELQRQFIVATESIQAIGQRLARLTPSNILPLPVRK